MKDHYSLLERISSFFSYNVYLRDKSRSSLAQHGEFLPKNPDHNKIFLKMAERWVAIKDQSPWVYDGINIYVV